MPNVLLIGGPNQLYKKLKADSRWNVVRAIIGEPPSRDSLGDPRRWQLVISDAAHYDGAQEEGVPPLVSKDYLGEAKNAPRIEFVAGHDEMVALVDTSGSHDLEFNATDEPEAAHLIDFVEEFEQYFQRVHLDIPGYAIFRKLAAFIPRRKDDPEFPYRSLFLDSYENPLIVLGDFTPPVLYIIDLTDDDVRLRAFEYLYGRTIPKLWPQVYADLFRPTRVKSLEREKEDLIKKFREKRADLEREIDKEFAFYSQFALLPQLADDPLKRLVKRTFEELLQCDVIDLDEETEEGEAKNLDLLLHCGRYRIFVEVASSGTRGCKKRDLEDMDEHMPSAEAKYGTSDSKVLVFNGLYRRNPEGRGNDKVFSRDVIREARTRDICLIGTPELLGALDAWRNATITGDQFLEALRRPGLLALPE